MNRIYLKAADVQEILGCASNKAYKVIVEVNDYAEKKNLMRFPEGRTNKYLFADLFGIPIEAINEAIKEE